MVPIDVEVFLIGFDGDGGYAHRGDTGSLINLLASGGNHHCPHSLETGEELAVCFQINYQILGGDELGGEAQKLLHTIEDHLKRNMKEVTDMNGWQGRGWARPGEPPGANRTVEYRADAAPMEPLFDAFMDYVYGQEHGEARGYHNWHLHNPIFVINPSKVRLNPKGSPDDAHHRVPDFLKEWQSGNYHPADLDKEEAGLTYTYGYNGVGEASAWLSSHNYLVIDVSSGPSSYGPAVSQEGAVTPGSIPSLREVYRGIFNDLKTVGAQLSAQQHAQVVARHSQKALFDGALSALVSSAALSLFVPDLATEHLEYAKNILIPVVLLTDYDLTDDDYEHRLSQEDFMHINLTHVEQAVARLIDESQEAVVVSAHHALSQHKQLEAALWKARRTKAEQATDRLPGKAPRVGYHTISHTAVDPAALLEELAQAADGLTHGLVAAAHAMSKEHAHPLEQLRHDGTRVVPVFVFSLVKAPDDIMFANKEMVAANHDAVMVLQLRHSSQWGGTHDDYFTGHLANGKRVAADARDVTRHVIAGLAQAIAGVVPPYSRPLPARHAPGSSADPPRDWRWAVGATPFGPYSSFAGVSGAMQSAARRNLLLSHVSAALRAAQHRLDDLDEFVAQHFQGPFAEAGIGADVIEGRRHFLDTVVGTRHGFKTAITPEVVAGLEGTMANLTQHLQGLAVDLYSHDFSSADKVIREQMLPAAAALCSGLDATLEEARAVMACCAARHVGGVGQVMWGAVAALVGFFAVAGAGAALAAATGRRRRSAVGMQLPTYGMSPYYGRPSSRQQHSWNMQL